MSQTENNISSTIQIFINAHTETSGDMEACEKIFSEKIQNDLPSFIKMCAQILTISQEIDDNIIKAKEMSINFLVDILDQKIYTRTSEALTNDEIVEELKNIIKQNILSDNETIRTKAIRCYSLLFTRLGSKWIDGINTIVDSFSNPNFIPNGTIVFFSIMSEITKEKSFDTTIYSSFSAQFIQIFVNALWVLSRKPTEEAFTAELRTSAAKYVYNIVSSAPQVLTDNEKEGARIPNILESLPNSFQIKNVELFQSIHEIFLILVKKFYSISPNFMEMISTFVMNGLQLQNEPKYTNASIYFWIKVAEFEYSIKQNADLPNINRIQPLQPLLIEIALPTLIPLFIFHVRNIDENDTAVENINQKPEPYMYATVAIAKFYQVFPRVIFDILKIKIEECINMDKWTDVHASLQMIYSISDMPVNDYVGQFIDQHFEKLIELSSPSQVPRIRVTSLFLIGLVLKNYPQIMSMADKFNCANFPQIMSMADKFNCANFPQIISMAGECTDKRITSIISTIESALNLDQEQMKNLSYDNTQILVRISKIIYHLSSVWKDCQHDSHISTFFDKLYEIIGILFNIGILSESKKIIQDSGESLNMLIFNSTSDCISKLDSIYAKKFKQITKNKELTCKEETRDLVQSSCISNLCTLLLKLRRVRTGFDIISKYALQTLECLYGFLDTNKSSCIYSEGFMAISALISATSQPENYIEVFDPASFNKLLSDFIRTGLSSSNEDVLNSTCLLIGNLFYFLSKRIPDLNNYIPVLFSTISDILMANKKEKRSCHPFLFKAISDIFNNADPNILKSDDLEIPLRELLTSWYGVSIDLDISNADDIQYGNLLYQYLTDAFGSYARVFYNPSDHQIERNQLFLLDKLATFIFKLYPKINENVYRSFLNTARKFADNCTRKNNFILNRHSVHRILKLGMENCHQPDLRKKLKEASDYLKSK